MSIELQVEHVSIIKGRVYVLARLTKPDEELRITPGATLNECAIEPWLTAPRALDAEGRPRSDLFAFCLKKSEDSARFQPGAAVYLTAPEPLAR